MEKENKDKPASPSRLYPIYILLTLKKYSSSQNPMSISEITQKVNKDFLTAYGDVTPINGSTVTRIMDALCTDINLGYQNTGIEFFNDPSECGFNIYCVMEDKSTEERWKYYKTTTASKGPKKYYYCESVFSESQLRTLIDAVETYNYFSTDDISGLVAKLLKLRPNSEYLEGYDVSIDQRHHLKDEDSIVFDNIDEFNRIIKNNQFAEIVYCSYNHEKKLVERDNYPRLVRPLSMMWSNGYYYLVALLGPGYTPANLRMDKIIDIVPVDPTEQQQAEYQVDMQLQNTIYRFNHPVMYGGKIHHITMLYDANMTTGMNNAIIDTFGKLTQIRPVAAKELMERWNINETSLISASETAKPFWVRADFQATLGGAELFATQYCRHCRIVSPPELAAKVKENLTKGLDLYGV